MNATATTVSTRGSISRILVLGTGVLMAFVLGAALALAATGWFAAADPSTPVFDATGALQSHVLRENGAAAAAPGPAVQDPLYEQVLRENRAR
jgi:hypothetical protein